MYLATLPLIKCLQIVDFFSFELHLANEDFIFCS